MRSTEKRGEDEGTGPGFLLQPACTTCGTWRRGAWGPSVALAHVAVPALEALLEHAVQHRGEEKGGEAAVLPLQLTRDVERGEDDDAQLAELHCSSSSWRVMTVPLDDKQVRAC